MIGFWRDFGFRNNNFYGHVAVEPKFTKKKWVKPALRVREIVPVRFIRSAYRSRDLIIFRTKGFRIIVLVDRPEPRFCHGGGGGFDGRPKLNSLRDRKNVHLDSRCTPHYIPRIRVLAKYWVTRKYLRLSSYTKFSKKKEKKRRSLR